MSSYKLNTALTIKFTDILRKGSSIHAACKAVGISRALYYQWVSKAKEGIPEYVNFITEVKQAESNLEQELTSLLIEELKEKKDTRQILEFLGRRFKQSWSPHATVSQDINQKITSCQIDIKKAIGEDADRAAEVLRLLHECRGNEPYVEDEDYEDEENEKQIEENTPEIDIRNTDRYKNADPKEKARLRGLVGYTD